MNVLLITKNQQIFSEDSLFYKEIIETAKQITALHVIVFTTKKDGFNFKSKKLSNNLYVYPTNSLFRGVYFFDALNIASLNIVWKFKCIVDLVIADGNLLSYFTSYIFSRKHKKNFLVNVGKQIINISSVFKRYFLEFIFNKATGIRVSGFYEGELLYGSNFALEKKIYLLPFYEELEENKPVVSAWDTNMHDFYKEFSVILLYMSNNKILMKNFKRNIEVLEELKKRYPKIGMVVIGEMKKNKFLPFYKIPSNIIFEKKLTTKNSKAEAYLKTANVYLDMSPGDFGGGSLVEAALSGCPIVALDDKISREIVKEGMNGFLIKGPNTKLAVRKIIEIIEFPGLREKMKLYRHMITSSYGKNIESYYMLLIDIWNKTILIEAPKEKNSDSKNPVGKVLKKVGTEVKEKVDKYKAFALDTYRGAIKNIEEKHEKEIALRVIANRELEGELIDNTIDLDTVDTDLERALREFEIEKRIK